ncbi:MAG: histidine triad nucleotide-binding protein [Proteobacteria bacterium]|nr:histidine triad nucleotide-binding protein [Pseudomonadota bacterium]
MTDCLFCKISAGTIPARVVYEDTEIMAFHDVHPQAPVHVLVIPRRHIVDLSAVTEQEKDLMGHLLVKMPSIAEKIGLSDGFRLVNNCKAPAGQSVFHVHFHLMGKRAFSWPPG